MTRFQTILDALSKLAAIFGFPIAILTIYLSGVEAQKSRDLTITISLVESFQQEWQGNWRQALTSLKKFQQAKKVRTIPPERLDELRDMLNWIDWLGLMMKSKMIQNDYVIISGTKHQLLEIINVAKRHIKKGLKKQGCDWWAGVIFVSAKLDPDLAEELVSSCKSGA